MQDQRMPQKWFSPLSLLEEIENLNWPLINQTTCQHTGQGLQISEDENSIFVEAAMPGLDDKDIELTYEKGTLMVRGERKETEEDKKRKYYRRSSNSFMYRLNVPGTIDEASEPNAEFKNGVVKVTFSKQKKAQPKRITIQTVK